MLKLRLKFRIKLRSIRLTVRKFEPRLAKYRSKVVHIVNSLKLRIQHSLPTMGQLMKWVKICIDLKDQSNP
jgi:predicted component of type VI protein secretion system